jgi:hypothetical protein
VPSAIGKSAADFLSNIDLDIAWREYEGLDHWYFEDMLRDVVRLLPDLYGWADQIHAVHEPSSQDETIMFPEFD